MTTKRAHEIMENELRCVQTASTNRCDRDCGKCPLVMDDAEIIEAYGMVIKMIETIKALEQEPFNIDTYCEEHFCVMVDKDVWGKAEKALKQEPCDDAISREATLKPYKGLNDEDTISVWLIRKNIEQQMSVNPTSNVSIMNEKKESKDTGRKLDETIERYASNAEYERTHGNLQGCLEFRQLAKWLRELKMYRCYLLKYRFEADTESEE